MGPPFTGHFRVTLDTPRGLSNLLHAGTKPSSGALALQQQTNGVTPHPSNLDLKKTIYHSTSKSSKPTTSAEAAKIADAAGGSDANAAPKTFTCETCGTDCTRTRYHSLKDGKYTICPSCFVSGRFPSTMYSGDFVRMDEEAFKQASSGAGAEWSDQETLLLLEGVEMYDDDWQAVAEHVGTRSKEQCIAQFLQLPIEDSYLSSDPAANLGPLRYQAGMNGLPFEGSENPVMSVVTFLASTVGPAVAAAAAQSALGELSQGLKRKRENGDTGSKTDEVKLEGQNGEASKETKTTEDAMVVDGETATTTATDAPAAVKETTTNGHAADSTAPSQSSVERAASLALGSAAAKASALARHEDARISQLVSRLVAAQVKKVELKLTMFERLEELLETEKRNVEIGRQNLFKDKLATQRSLARAEELIKRAKEGNDLPAVEKEVKEVRNSLGGSTAHGTKEVQGEQVQVPDRSESTFQQL